MNSDHIIIAINRPHSEPSFFFFLLVFFFVSNLISSAVKMGEICPLTSNLNCTVETCPLTCAQVDYLPTFGGNVAYAAVFGLLLVVQLWFGIKYKTWGFMVGMICGLLLEVVGYVGRIMLHNNPFNFNNFIM